MNLLGLVAPLSRTEFVKNFFEKKPFLSTRNSLCVNLCWLNKEWLRSTLKDKAFPTPILDMADGTRRIDKSRFTRLIKVGIDSTRLPDQDKIWKLHDSQKISLMLQAIEQWHQEVASLTQYLVKNCYGYMGANLYCTPKGAKTFPKHFDTHEVFIAQTEGKKTWHIWNPDYRNPRRGDKFSGDASLPPDYIITVGAGDILYIPRGFPHAAASTDELSIHITFGLTLLNVSDVLEFIAAHNDGSALRAGLLLDGSTGSGAECYPEALRNLESVFDYETFKLAPFTASLEKFGLQQNLKYIKPKKQRHSSTQTIYKVSTKNFRYFYLNDRDKLTIAAQNGALEVEGGISSALARFFSTQQEEIEFIPEHLIKACTESLTELVKIGVLSVGGRHASGSKCP